MQTALKSELNTQCRDLPCSNEVKYSYRTSVCSKIFLPFRYRAFAFSPRVFSAKASGVKKGRIFNIARFFFPFHYHWSGANDVWSGPCTKSDALFTTAFHWNKLCPRLFRDVPSREIYCAFHRRRAIRFRLQ